MGMPPEYGNLESFFMLVNFSLTLIVFVFSGKISAQWALDDVLIGMNDSSLSDFQDTFDDSSDLQLNWYRIQGGNPDMYCLSKDTALVFNLNIGR